MGGAQQVDLSDGHGSQWCCALVASPYSGQSEPPNSSHPHTSGPGHLFVADGAAACGRVNVTEAIRSGACLRVKTLQPGGCTLHTKKAACLADVKRRYGHAHAFFSLGFTRRIRANFLRARSSHFAIVTGERRISHVIGANWWFWLEVSA